MMPPSPEDLIAQIEQALATLPADSEEYAALAALRDQIRQGIVQIEQAPATPPADTSDQIRQNRSSMVAGPQIDAVYASHAYIATHLSISLPAGDAGGVRIRLAHLAAHYGATPDAGADARILQQMREWRIPDEDAALALVRQRLCDGVAELGRAPVSAAPLSPRAAALQTALLLLPLIEAQSDGRELPFRWAEIILAIGCPDLVEPLITVRRAWHSSDERGRQAALLAFTQALEQPARRASMQALLGYMQALVESGEAQADAALRAAIERRAATPDAMAHRLALLALAAAIGGVSGAAAATIIARASAQEPPAPRQGAEEQPTRQGSRTVRYNIVQTRAGPMVVPVTPEQWRATLEERDERFGDHGLRQTPIPYWCYVRGGRYRIGGWKRGEPGADVLLRPFWIARVPITVAQYRAFVEGGGYARDTYWTPHRRAWKRETKRTHPWGWDKPQYMGANQPVIGVTWYEAMAFCAWLQEWVQPVETQHAASLRAQRAAPRPVALPEGYTFRLPTEAEWEVAAAYDNNGRRRPYPWGNDEPTPERAVYAASGVHAPAPVGSCPAGAAACGALDVAGNVWEVTASRWDAYPAGSAQRVEDFAPDDWQVPWRGGSWWNSSTFVRCGARGRYLPGDYWDFNVGFRIVVAPHSH